MRILSVPEIPTTQHIADFLADLGARAASFEYSTVTEPTSWVRIEQVDLQLAGTYAPTDSDTLTMCRLARDLVQSPEVSQLPELAKPGEGTVRFTLSNGQMLTTWLHEEQVYMDYCSTTLTQNPLLEATSGVLSSSGTTSYRLRAEYARDADSSETYRSELTSAVWLDGGGERAFSGSEYQLATKRLLPILNNLPVPQLGRRAVSGVEISAEFIEGQLSVTSNSWQGQFEQYEISVPEVLVVAQMTGMSI